MRRDRQSNILRANVDFVVFFFLSLPSLELGLYVHLEQDSSSRVQYRIREQTVLARQGAERSSDRGDGKIESVKQAGCESWFQIHG
jgi:hypothetical protein